MTQFAYAPGLPGYGHKGIDGSLGIQGIATYFSQYNGDTQKTTIKSKIQNNFILAGAVENLPGYPIRVYQNGDIFIDVNGSVFIIDFSEINLFKDTGVDLTSSSFYASQFNTITTGFERWANPFSTTGSAQRVTDIIYSNSDPADYGEKPYNIYLQNTKDFATIHYSDIKVIADSGILYYPFTTYTAGQNTILKTSADSFSIVREVSANIWHIGNLNSSGTQRDVSLNLDFTGVTGSFYGNIYGDVSALINITDSANATASILFVDSAIGYQYLRTDSQLTYNADTGALTVSGGIVGNADTATTATNIITADESSDTTCNIVFVTGPTDTLPKTGTNLIFNSNSGKLTATLYGGSWVGDAISVIRGGTGLVSPTDNYVMVGTGSADITMVSPTSTSGRVLTSNGLSTAPSFQDISGGADGVLSGINTTDLANVDFTITDGSDVLNIDFTSTFAEITSKPNTLSGYSISDTKTNFDAACSDGNFLYTGDADNYNSWTISATSGGTTDITSGVTMNIAAGTDISTTESTATVTIAFTNASGYTTNTGTVTGNGANNRMAFWTDASALSSLSNLTQASAVVTGIDFIATSDERLKKDFKPFGNVLSNIMGLSGKLSTFKWKEDELNQFEFNVGYSAQEMKKWFPKIVNPSGLLIDEKKEDSGKYLAISYTKLSGIALEGIAELKEEKDLEIDDLKTENRDLKDRLEKLEKIVNKLI